MVTGVTQKSYTALFPLWSLRKNDISKNREIYIKRKHVVLKAIYAGSGLKIIGEFVPSTRPYVQQTFVMWYQWEHI